jgi:hypothetical protein
VKAVKTGRHSNAKEDFKMTGYSKEKFLQMAFDTIPGAKLSEQELDDLIAHGRIEICEDGSIPFEALVVAKNWISSQRHDLATWDGTPTRPIPGHERKDYLSAPSGFSSGNAEAQLEKIVKEKMKADKSLTYRDALLEAQKEYPQLAAQVAQGLDVYRHRDDKPRF